MSLSELASRQTHHAQPGNGRTTSLAEVMVALQDLGNDDQTIVAAVSGMLESGMLRRPATRH